MNETKSEQTNLAYELNVPARFEIATVWALAAQQVAEITQDSHALKIWDFVNNKTTIGVAMPEGGVHSFFNERPVYPIDTYAYLTPIVEADIERLPANDFRRQLVEGISNTAAQYREGSHAIYLPQHNFGTLGKGVLLQHEAMHAWLDLEMHIDHNPKNAHWLEEADVFKFEFGLLEKLIGSPYTDLVTKVAMTIGSTDDMPNAISTSYEFTDEDKNVISEGLYTTDAQETDFWLGTVLTLNAFFEYFQRYFDNPHKEFAEFLKATYPSDL